MTSRVWIGISLVLSMTSCKHSSSISAAPVELSTLNFAKDPARTVREPTFDACEVPEWLDGKFYREGSKVHHSGKLYVATHANNYGTEPTVQSYVWLETAECLPPSK